PATVLGGRGGRVRRAVRRFCLRVESANDVLSRLDFSRVLYVCICDVPDADLVGYRRAATSPVERGLDARCHSRGEPGVDVVVGRSGERRGGEAAKSRFGGRVHGARPRAEVATSTRGTKETSGGA